MKRLKLLILFVLVAASSVLYAQDKKSKKELKEEQAAMTKKLVEMQDYRFVAQIALPMSFRTVYLTSDYDLTVCRDTISAYLPYYGRVYVAPMNPSEGGIKFVSTDFTYKVESAKKGGWSIYITTKDTQRRFEMTLNISTSGATILTVNDVTRRSISFNGYLEKRKAAK
jgi:type II secretory pathway pseudopilin PulG